MEVIAVQHDNDDMGGMLDSYEALAEHLTAYSDERMTVCGLLSEPLYGWLGILAGFQVIKLSNDTRQRTRPVFAPRQSGCLTARFGSGGSINLSAVVGEIDDPLFSHGVCEVRVATEDAEFMPRVMFRTQPLGGLNMDADQTTAHIAAAMDRVNEFIDSALSPSAAVTNADYSLRSQALSHLPH